MRVIIFFAALSLIVFMISLIGPLMRYEHNVGFKASSIVSSFSRLTKALEGLLMPFFRLRTLEQENFSLMLENRQLLSLLSEVKIGHKRDPANFISANVSGIDPQLAGVLIVDKGITNGIDDGHFVADENFLVVGSTYGASDKFSKVRTIYSPGLTFNVADFSGILLGSATSRGLSGIEVNFVDPRTVINENDYVVTAGQDLVFPRGFLVGRVVKAEKSGSFLRLLVAPLVDVNKISKVYIQR